MSFNLIDSVKNVFSNEFLSKASAVTGENENNVKTAIGGIIPSILTGLLGQASSGSPQSILNMAKEASQTGILGNLTGFLGNGSLLSKGTDLLKSIFGDRFANVSSLISGFSGIRESSAASLMSVAAPAALGVLGKHAAETNMSSSGLLSFLNTQKDSILAAVPSGLNLAGALGLGSLASIGSKLSGKLADIKGTAGAGAEKLVHSLPDTKKVNWLPLVLGAIAIIALIVLLSKGCNGGDSKSATVPVDTVRPDTAMSQPAAPVRESMKVKLPNGVELDAYRGGIEDQLVSFLENPANVPGKDVWFDFDNLNFNSSSAVITEGSNVQVQNIAAILKAFPKVKIKIGGYTDRTGDSMANLKLSQSRATAVVDALKADGANGGQVIGAEGYGSQFAKAGDNASDEEKQKDRRISVSVRAK